MLIQKFLHINFASESEKNEGKNTRTTNLKTKINCS
jgi:hypothetical protein